MFDYDVSYRVMRMQHFPGGAAHPTYGIRMTPEYGYDEMHQKLYEKKLYGAGQFYIPADSFVYRYDSAHRLQRADKKPGLDTVPVGTRIDPYQFPSLFDDFTAYTLDGVNNRVLTNYGGILDTGYSYDGANRLLVKRDNLNNRLEYQYDANSNPTHIAQVDIS